MTPVRAYTDGSLEQCRKPEHELQRITAPSRCGEPVANRHIMPEHSRPFPQTTTGSSAGLEVPFGPRCRVACPRTC